MEHKEVIKNAIEEVRKAEELLRSMESKPEKTIEHCTKCKVIDPDWLKLLGECRNGNCVCHRELSELVVQEYSHIVDRPDSDIAEMMEKINHLIYLWKMKKQ